MIVVDALIPVKVGKKTYTARVHHDKKEKYAYSGRCVELPAAITAGRTMDELKKNMKEAIQLVLKATKDVPSKPQLA